MTWVAGVDGCRDGWFAVFRDIETGQCRAYTLGHIFEVLKLPHDPPEQPEPEIVAVDMPIGLLDCAEHGGRQCDREARKLLGQPRGAAVFPPPVRAALKCRDFGAANRANKRSSPGKIGIPLQCYCLFPKLREVDGWMNATKQERVFEVHPELCFYELNNKQPMGHGKKRTDGFKERERLLKKAGLGEIVERALSDRPPRVANDDILDACVACWSAGRILRGKAICTPENPPQDSRGLRMEIWR
jgi:predicted RNase H-like nuclease